MARITIPPTEAEIASESVRLTRRLKPVAKREAVRKLMVVLPDIFPCNAAKVRPLARNILAQLRADARVMELQIPEKALIGALCWWCYRLPYLCALAQGKRRRDVNYSKVELIDADTRRLALDAVMVRALITQHPELGTQPIELPAMLLEDGSFRPF